jgi:ADP-ribose pyrophosphatase YjhB (NUDIX family)
LTGEWKKGAGVVFVHCADDGPRHVLLGKRKRDKYSAMLSSAGFCSHGWTIPFGELEQGDCGDFRRCAIREAAEEAFGVPEGCRFEQCVSRLESVVGGPLHHLIDQVPPFDLGASAGGLGGLLLRMLGVEYRTYLVPVRNRSPAVGDWQFETGTMNWYPSKDVPFMKPRHFALEPALRSFGLWPRAAS